ncbi:pentatricopeptide repeat-containing protein [Forsythia ovata]|uniref:Pentatricopeptide repeat-containing protein n=1 Tax=Forsythia ovata TaxID=205694 RepID=A0ABD1R447_9LAMI
MLAATASKFKAKLSNSKFIYHYYHRSNFLNTTNYGVTLQLYVKGIWGFTATHGDRNYHVISYVKSIPVRTFWIWPFFAIFSHSVGNRQSIATQVSPPQESTNEILNEILVAIEESSVSREEICNTYVNKLCTAGDLLAAARLMQALIEKHIFLSPHAYEHLLEAAGEKNDIDLHLQIFKDFLVSCDSVRLTSYLILARVFVKFNDPVILLKFIREVSEMVFPRNEIVLNRLIFAFAKCGHVDKALFVFDHMKSLECKPDLVTYNTILGILGRLGRVDEMLHEFAAMKNVDLIPDIVTYNTLLTSLWKVGRFDLCLVYFREMSDRGVQPDLRTYKALIESLGRSGKIEEALRIFEEMKRKRIQPSIHIYRALIFSLKRTGKMELALKFSKEMKESLSDFVVPKDLQWKKR